MALVATYFYYFQLGLGISNLEKLGKVKNWTGLAKRLVKETPNQLVGQLKGGQWGLLVGNQGENQGF